MSRSMKQHKIPAPTKNSTQLRQEIDHCVKEIMNKISNNPKKAALILEAWTKEQSKPQKHKRAA